MEQHSAFFSSISVGKLGEASCALLGTGSSHQLVCFIHSYSFALSVSIMWVL